VRIGDTLKVNNTLDELQLGNAIKAGNIGCNIITNALLINQSLERHKMKRGSSNKEGKTFEALVRMLEKNKSLKRSTLPLILTKRLMKDQKKKIRYYLNQNTRRAGFQDEEQA
jgi:hypothetical protein